eukprot:jgi/Orpsp1_1/1175992/evm.model.c7180000055992.1
MKSIKFLPLLLITLGIIISTIHAEVCENEKREIYWCDNSNKCKIVKENSIQEIEIKKCKTPTRPPRKVPFPRATCFTCPDKRCEKLESNENKSIYYLYGTTKTDRLYFITDKGYCFPSKLEI